MQVASAEAYESTPAGTSTLPALFESLAQPSQYDIATPGTRTQLKRALYAFALSPESPFHLLNTNITDDWTLCSAQEATRLGAEYSESRRGKACGHVFRAGESVYRCRDCALDPTCVLCSKCFHGSSHSRLGHDVTMSTHAGAGAGCCDCGDVEAFRDGCHTDCKYHAANLASDGPGGTSITPEIRELRGMIQRLLSVLVDWMIAVLETSPTEMAPPKTVQDIMASSSSTAPVSPIDSDLPTYTSSTSRGKAREDAPAGPWSVVLWNDEKHSFDQVIEQVRSATGMTRRAASDVAQRVDTHGRDVIYISRDPTQLLAVSKHISDIALAVTVRSAQDTFYEQVAGELIHFMKDLVTCQVDGESGALMDVIAEVLVRQYGNTSQSRFQRLLEVDARLWHSARRGLAELYVSLLGVNQEIKLALSIQYAQVYDKIAETYLLNDREYEHSIITLGVQVFTVPSVSRHLVAEHQFLPRVISILYAFFTEQFDATKKHLILPPAVPTRKIDLELDTFKHKRYFQIFSDLGHLISSKPVQQVLWQTPALWEPVGAFIALFTSMNPSERATDTHVEYESDVWVTAFNVTIQLGKICRSYGEAFRSAAPVQLANALKSFLGRLINWERDAVTIHTVQVGNHLFDLVKFDVAKEPVSFHHPLAWLFAEISKNVDALDADTLKSAGLPSLTELVLGRRQPLAFLSALDHPLRVIVLVAQIRAGLWVRNGFAMRAQQLHYKEYSLRENTYDQDMYFLQLALVVLDPSLVFAAMLDRFQVLEWLSTESTHPTYEPAQAIAMVEEMLYTIIVLLSDPTYADGQSDQVALRREIVHNLCLGPCAYSELMRRVSERFTDDPNLDRILGEVSLFKQPVGTADQGTYTLRAECYREVNPYFPRYSRNQREEAEKIVREQLKKQSSTDDDPIIVPSRIDIRRGPFVTLTQALNSDVLHRIIFYSLRAGRARGPTLFSEVVVDEGLHLVMLALVEQPEAFAHFAQSPAPREGPALIPDDEATLVHLLAKIETDERMKAVWHKARWCLDRLTDILAAVMDVRSLRKVEDTSAAQALEAKRAAAKARQSAIMKQFAQAQQSFLDNVLDEDDDDEEADDDMGDVDAPPPKPSLGSCIVCQDELNSEQDFGVLGLVRSSNFIRQTLFDDVDIVTEALETPTSLDQDASRLRPYGLASKHVYRPDEDSDDGVSRGYPQATQSGLYASSCGHMMHLGCFVTYYKSVEQRHHAQPVRNHPENTHRHEFVCPLCKSLGNVLLPHSADNDEISLTPSADFEEWTQSMRDPIQAAVDAGSAHMLAEELSSKARNLSIKERAGGFGLKPWRISVMLPSIASQEFDRDGPSSLIARLLGVTMPLTMELHGGNARPASLHDELLAFTVSAVEIASRGTTESAQELPEATVRLLRSFILVLKRLVEIQIGTEDSADVAPLAVVSHVGGIFAQDTANSDFYQLRPLATMIEGAIIMPSAFYHMLAYCFYTELMQNFMAIVKLASSSQGVANFRGETDQDLVTEYEALASIRHFFVESDGFGITSDRHAATLGRLLYAYTLPFLRRAAILARAYLGVDAVAPSPNATGSEFGRLLAQLRIASPALVFVNSGSDVAPAVKLLREHIFALRASIPGWRQNMVNPPLPARLPDWVVADAAPLQHPAIYELVGLPRQLDTLTAVSLQRKCQRCDNVPDNPAMCLLCGQILCNQSFCCMDSEEEAQHGECNTHMWTCGGSIGIYYVIKRNAILYLYADKGSFTTPPYLDSHGEVDFGGRARNQFPQFLHSGRYDEIRKIWLTHGIPTFVARKLDAGTDHGGWTLM